MPAKGPRITTVVDEEERFWAREGESRLETFDRQTAVSHEDAWD